MSEPRWLTRAEVEFIQKSVVEVGGGSHGLRDAALLESALARPQNQYSYGETDTFQLAASYAEAIARNHAFVDGNKRTAFQAADIFLLKNGQHLNRAKDVEHAKMMEALGQGNITREAAAEHLRQHSLSIDKALSNSEQTEGKGKESKKDLGL